MLWKQNTIGITKSDILSLINIVKRVHAINNDNNMNYPFPIIFNGLTPAAVISYAENNGGEGSTIVIQTNKDISNFVGYIIIKYVKE